MGKYTKLFWRVGGGSGMSFNPNATWSLASYADPTTKKKEQANMGEKRESQHEKNVIHKTLGVLEV